MTAEKCQCPLLENASPSLEFDLYIDRRACAGAITTEIGTRVCRVYMARLKEHANNMTSPSVEAEQILEQYNDEAGSAE